MKITDAVVIDEAELHESFVLNSGPGGQNVNKVHTAVQLRFNFTRSNALHDGAKARLRQLAGARATKAGEIIIEAREYRTQGQNRAAARRKLKALLEKALRPPTKRKRTQIPYSAKRKRLLKKRERSDLKSNRRTPTLDS